MSPAGTDLSAAGVRNVQYVIKFLAELSKKSETTKGPVTYDVCTENTWKFILI